MSSDASSDHSPFTEEHTSDSPTMDRSGDAVHHAASSGNEPHDSRQVSEESEPPAGDEEKGVQQPCVPLGHDSPKRGDDTYDNSSEGDTNQIGNEQERERGQGPSDQAITKINGLDSYTFRS